MRIDISNEIDKKNMIKWNHNVKREMGANNNLK